MGDILGAVGGAVLTAACIVGIGFFARLGMELADYLIYSAVSRYLDGIGEDGG